MAQPSFMIEWEAHEYEHKDRSPDWFWAVGIVSVALSIVSIIFGNIILAILILVAAFTLLTFAKRPPENIRVAVDDKGITRDKIHYPFQTLKSFYIDTEHPHKKIFFRSEKVFMPLIHVPLGEGVDVEKLHQHLSTHLSEEFHSLTLIERILDHLGF